MVFRRTPSLESNIGIRLCIIYVRKLVYIVGSSHTSIKPLVLCNRCFKYASNFEM